MKEMLRAQNVLGLMYEDGKGVEQNDHEAFNLYKSAADQGLAAAQHNLARMYESGIGVDEG
jgi:TPR repeat protein